MHRASSPAARGSVGAWTAARNARCISRALPSHSLRSPEVHTQRLCCFASQTTAGQTRCPQKRAQWRQKTISTKSRTAITRDARHATSEWKRAAARARTSLGRCGRASRGSPTPADHLTDGRTEWGAKAAPAAGATDYLVEEAGHGTVGRREAGAKCRIVHDPSQSGR